MDISRFAVKNDQFSLKDFATRCMTQSEDDEIKSALYQEDISELRRLHEKLNAESKEGILVILQALDAAGKDEIIQSVFSNLKPQGIRVSSTSKPTEEEKDRDYLWQTYKGLPKRGEIAILNRSYYEEIIAPQIHQSIEESHLPERVKNKDIVKNRYRHLKNFEEYLYDNGFRVVKLFFHLSKGEQAERLLMRLKDKTQQFEFSFSDLDDRAKWDDYQDVFEQMIKNTATDIAPWYILPADNPWLSRKIATQVLIELINEINPQYPTFDKDQKDKVEAAIQQLQNELNND